MTSHIETLEKEPNTKQRETDLLKRQRGWVKRAVQNKQKIPYVLFNGFDEAIPILPMEFSFDTAGLGKNVRLQIPIKLAFAITVHKSQGMSLDSCFVDASKVFAEAQVYVALSRCRSAAGLQIENLRPTKIKAPQDALDFYNHLREPNTYLPNTHKWWQGRPGPKSQRERAAVRILRQYYDPLREEYPDGSFSEYLSVRHDRMRKLASDEQLETVPDWKCRACNHRRDYSLECCFLAREQVDRDIDENVFASWSQRRNSSSSDQGIRNEELQLRETPCPKCPKSGGPQACPECSPENFCFLTEHGNSGDDPLAKNMCPKCSPQNFCTDAKHGHSEESPAHMSACKKCSYGYFERQGRRSVDTRNEDITPSTRRRARSDDDDDDDRDLERSLRRRRAENERLQLEAENVRLQIQIQKDMIQLAALQGEGQIQIQEDISRLARLQGERGRRKAPCSECPKSGGPQACPECSPLNFCFLTEHGNSRDAPSAKTMCPKCSPQNFCRDAEHGQSEESPAHKSSCVKCSPEYFGCVENPNAFRNPGSTRV